MYGISKGASGVGLALLLVPVVPIIWMGTSNAVNNVVSKARVEERKIAMHEEEQTVRDGINERQKTLNVASAAGAHTSYSEKHLKNYVYSSHVNPRPSTKPYGSEELVQVFDKNGVCVGLIKNNRWLFRPWYENACSNSETSDN